MADGFEVRDDALGRLARDLRAVTDVMGKAMDSMASHGGAGTLGTGELDSACSSFKDAWSYGLGKLRDDLQATTEDIVDTAKQYDQAEQEIARALDEFRLPA
ncbi:MAG TPA: type VII secretion target [Marmoricola sp.]|nr:type VII secretion target [Marmoricola sp.]